jgi:hypothetical protein
MPEWWHVDKQGRKIGYMWPEDFHSILDSVWGHRKGAAGFVEYSGWKRTTVDDWCKGRAPVPKHAAQLALLIQRLTISARSEGKEEPWTYLPQHDASWLASEKISKKTIRRPFG